MNKTMISVLGMMVIAGLATAQPPAVVPPPTVMETAPVVLPAVTTTDEDILAAVKMLTGSFKAPAIGGEGGQPELTLHTAVINVEGLDNALYFEINRADTPQLAFSQGVFHLFRQTVDGGAKELRLRVFTFDRLGASFADAMVGLWLAPDAFPAVAADKLAPMVDITLKKSGAGFTGTGGPAPINRAGATLLLSSFEIAKDTLRINDRGVKPDGSPAFGSGVGLTFTRFESPIKPVRLAGGLITFDLVTGDGIAAADGDDLALQYAGWLRADGFQFDTSRQEGRPPLQFSLPAQLMQGWNLGIPGVKKGTVRRLIIPPGMGYGDSGRRQARIPPNAWLVFEAECIYLKDNPPPPPPQPEAERPATGAPK